MPNRYGGNCYKCGEYVKPGDGVFEKVSHIQRKKWPDMPRTIKWLTQHHECVRDYSRDTHYIYNPKEKVEVRIAQGESTTVFDAKDTTGGE